MQWYYLSDSHERIAISENQFPALAARGTVRPSTLVWHAGMTGWSSCGEVLPGIFTAGIARDSDGRHPLTAGTMLPGTITGLSRTLAAYNVWIRILAAALLITGILGAAGFGMFAARWLNAGTKAMMEWPDLPAFAGGDPIKLWLTAGFQVISFTAGFGAGISLLRSARLAKKAVASGSEAGLTAALQSLGRYFVITASLLLFTVLFWLAMILWSGVDTVFPASPPPASRSVVL